MLWEKTAKQEYSLGEQASGARPESMIIPANGA